MPLPSQTNKKVLSGHVSLELSDTGKMLEADLCRQWHLQEMVLWFLQSRAPCSFSFFADYELPLPSFP